MADPLNPNMFSDGDSTATTRGVVADSHEIPKAGMRSSQRLGTLAHQYMMENAAYHTETGEKGAYGRKLVNYKDSDGNDVQDKMVRLGLAYATTREQSARIMAEKILGIAPKLSERDLMYQHVAEQLNEQLPLLDQPIFVGNRAHERWMNRENNRVKYGSELTRSISRGWDNTQASFGDAAIALGNALDMESLVEWGDRTSATNTLAANIQEREVRSLRDVFDDPNASLADRMYSLSVWALESGFEETLPMLMDVTIATAGSMAGGLGMGAVASRRIAKRGMRDAVNRYLDNNLSNAGLANAQNNLMGKASTRLMVGKAQSEGAKVGGVAGFLGSNVPQSVGEAQSSAEELGVEDSGLSSLVTGVFAAGIDTMADWMLVGRLMKGYGLPDREVKPLLYRAKRAATEIGKAGLSQAAVEGTTEALQEATYLLSAVMQGGDISNIAPDGDWRSALVWRLAEAAVAGAVVGGVSGAVANGVGQLSRPSARNPNDVTPPNDMEDPIPSDEPTPPPTDGTAPNDIPSYQNPINVDFLVKTTEATDEEVEEEVAKTTQKSAFSRAMNDMGEASMMKVDYEPPSLHLSTDEYVLQIREDIANGRITEDQAIEHLLKVTTQLEDLGLLGESDRPSYKKSLAQYHPDTIISKDGESPTEMSMRPNSEKTLTTLSDLLVSNAEVYRSVKTFLTNNADKYGINPDSISLLSANELSSLALKTMQPELFSDFVRQFDKEMALLHKNKKIPDDFYTQYKAALSYSRRIRPTFKTVRDLLGDVAASVRRRDMPESAKSKLLAKLGTDSNGDRIGTEGELYLAFRALGIKEPQKLARILSQRNETSLENDIEDVADIAQTNLFTGRSNRRVDETRTIETLDKQVYSVANLHRAIYNANMRSSDSLRDNDDANYSVIEIRERTDRLRDRAKAALMVHHANFQKTGKTKLPTAFKDAYRFFFASLSASGAFTDVQSLEEQQALAERALLDDAVYDELMEKASFHRQTDPVNRNPLYTDDGMPNPQGVFSITEQLAEDPSGEAYQLEGFGVFDEDTGQPVPNNELVTGAPDVQIQPTDADLQDLLYHTPKEGELYRNNTGFDDALIEQAKRKPLMPRVARVILRALDEGSDMSIKRLVRFAKYLAGRDAVNNQKLHTKESLRSLVRVYAERAVHLDSILYHQQKTLAAFTEKYGVSVADVMFDHNLRLEHLRYLMQGYYFKAQVGSNPDLVALDGLLRSRMTVDEIARLDEANSIYLTIHNIMTTPPSERAFNGQFVDGRYAYLTYQDEMMILGAEFDFPQYNLWGGARPEMHNKRSERTTATWAEFHKKQDIFKYLEYRTTHALTIRNALDNFTPPFDPQTGVYGGTDAEFFALVVKYLDGENMLDGGDLQRISSLAWNIVERAAIPDNLNIEDDSHTTILTVRNGNRTFRINLPYLVDLHFRVLPSTDIKSDAKRVLDAFYDTMTSLADYTDRYGNPLGFSYSPLTAMNKDSVVWRDPEGRYMTAGDLVNVARELNYWVGTSIVSRQHYLAIDSAHGGLQQLSNILGFAARIEMQTTNAEKNPNLSPTTKKAMLALNRVVQEYTTRLFDNNKYKYGLSPKDEEQFISLSEAAARSPFGYDADVQALEVFILSLSSGGIEPSRFISESDTDGEISRLGSPIHQLYNEIKLLQTSDGMAQMRETRRHVSDLIAASHRLFDISSAATQAYFAQTYNSVGMAGKAVDIYDSTPLEPSAYDDALGETPEADVNAQSRVELKKAEFEGREKAPPRIFPQMDDATKARLRAMVIDSRAKMNNIKFLTTSDSAFDYNGAYRRHREKMRKQAAKVAQEARAAQPTRIDNSQSTTGEIDMGGTVLDSLRASPVNRIYQVVAERLLGMLGVRTPVTVYNGNLLDTQYKQIRDRYGDEVVGQFRLLMAEGHDGFSFSRDGRLFIYVPEGKRKHSSYARGMLILGHEVGHAFFKNVIVNNPAFASQMQTEYENDIQNDDNPPPIEEWFADRFSRYAIEQMEKLGLLTADKTLFLREAKGFLLRMGELYDTVINLIERAKPLFNRRGYFHSSTSFDQFMKNVFQSSARIDLDQEFDGEFFMGKRRNISIREVSAKWANGSIQWLKPMLARAQAFSPELRKMVERYSAIRRRFHSNAYGRDMRPASLTDRRMQKAYEDWIQGVNSTESQLLRRWMGAVKSQFAQYGFIDPMAFATPPYRIRLDALEKNPDDFIALVADALSRYNAAKGTGYSEVRATDMVNRLLDNNGMLMHSFSSEMEVHGISSPSSTLLARTVFGDVELVRKLSEAGYLDTDAISVVDNFINQLVSYTAFSDVFGGSTLKEPHKYSAQMRFRAFVPDLKLRQIYHDSNLTVGQKKELRSIVDALTGRVHRTMPFKLRVAQNWLLAISNMSILAFAGVASTPDVSTGAIRTHSFRTVIDGFKYLLSSPSEVHDMARALGVTSSQFMHHNFMEMVGNQSFMHGMPSWAQRMFFHANLQSTVNFVSQHVNVAMATAMLKSVAYRDTATNRRLAKRYDLDINTLRAYFELDPHSPQTAYSQSLEAYVKQRITDFVTSSTMMGERANSPLLAQNPYAQILFNLKKFFYDFHEIVIMTVARETKSRYKEAMQGQQGFTNKAVAALLATPYAARPMLLASMMLMPLAALGWEMREWIRDGKDPSEYDTDEYIAKLIARTGVIGLGELALPFYYADQYDRPYATAAIPMASMLYDVTTAENWETKAKRMTPFANQIPALNPYG